MVLGLAHFTFCHTSREARIPTGSHFAHTLCSIIKYRLVENDDKLTVCIIWRPANTYAMWLCFALILC